MVVQKSLREGFGLTVTEAMWKGTPVIGGNVGGIRYQIRDGENGFLVSSIEETARRIVQLVEEPETARSNGPQGAGGDSVTSDFLYFSPFRFHSCFSGVRRFTNRSNLVKGGDSVTSDFGTSHRFVSIPVSPVLDALPTVRILRGMMKPSRILFARLPAPAPAVSSPAR